MSYKQKKAKTKLQPLQHQFCLSNCVRHLAGQATLQLPAVHWACSCRPADPVNQSQLANDGCPGLQRTYSHLWQAKNERIQIQTEKALGKPQPIDETRHPCYG